MKGINLEQSQMNTATTTETSRFCRRENPDTGIVTKCKRERVQKGECYTVIIRGRFNRKCSQSKFDRSKPNIARLCQMVFLLFVNIVLLLVLRSHPFPTLISYIGILANHFLKKNFNTENLFSYPN